MRQNYIIDYFDGSKHFHIQLPGGLRKEGKASKSFTLDGENSEEIDTKLRYQISALLDEYPEKLLSWEQINSRVKVNIE